nr:hypothetical protein [Anaerolineae bacterium]
LRGESDIDLVGPIQWGAGEDWVWPHEAPDIVLAACKGTRGDREGTRMVAELMERYPESALVQVALERKSVRVLTPQEVSASTDDLLETLRNAPLLAGRGRERTEDAGS